MKNFIIKIVNSFLAITFAFGLITLTYYTTRHETAMLSASVLDKDGALPVAASTYLEPAGGVEFVTPKGSVYPTNGVVTINSVYINFTAAAEGAGYEDGYLNGSDLEGSFISFSSGSVACPAGTVYADNKIILPSNFSTACSVEIDVPGVNSISTVDLTIEPVSCQALQTSILRGQGEGFSSIPPANLGTFASTASLKGFDFGAITTSVDLNYPTADNDVSNAKTFQIHTELKPDISTDAINGIDSRAKIVSNNGNGVYELQVRTEGTGSEAQTALNFAYIFNDLLGSDSPFVAYPDPTNPEKILLQATEMGDHPHDGTGEDYVCIVDGTEVTSCFSNGVNGTGVGLGVLTTPLKLDNEVLQGDSGIVFASNSFGEINWISSHPSILEVSTLSEAAQSSEGVADFVDTTLSVATSTGQDNGAYIVDCKKEYTDASPPVFVSETCSSSVSIPVSSNISGVNYTVNVTIEDEVVPVVVQGSQLNGQLEGTASYSSGSGAGYSLSGTLTGLVSGSVSGTYSGTVTGQIQVDMQSSADIDPLGTTELTPNAFKIAAAKFTINAVTTGTISDLPGTLTSTVKKQEDDVSHVAILYGKRTGTSILSAMDKQGCIASFEVDVIEKEVVLQMVGRNPGDVLDVSDTVQINAFVGGANSELEEYDNITAASGIEWFSSNEDVATIDQTGLLTALKPGVTNLTARYDTDDAEIGTIESIPMKVTVNKIANLRVTFDKGTEDLLSTSVTDAAHGSVIIAIHNPEAAGQSFVIEGQTVNITLPAGTYSNKISKVTAIVNQLNTDITALTNALPLPAATAPAVVVNVTTIDGYPGMLILQPATAQDGTDNNANSIQGINENNRIDIDTTALESDVAILPTYNNAIPLPASETYGIQVIAQYDNGATKLLPPTQFSWVNTPVNYLEQASLDSGLIKMGEISGTSTVVAQYENADASLVQSNYLTIKVDSGPVIEFVRRIGSGSVTKGSRINLQTKISDVNTVSDISSISTSLVYSSFSTYQQINADSSAIWFTAIPFLNEISVVDQGGTTEEEGDSDTTPQTVALQYKTYDIPIEIPVDQNLFDGVYSLILSISDASNHTLNYVFPIRIGEIGEGDVNGDSTTNMVDVILAFQIASGINPSPTPSELQAANVDGVGGVTLVDVILLFNKVTNKA